MVIAAALLLAGCGGTAEVAEEETAHPSEEDIVTYGGAYRFDYNGWVYLHIEGEPYERGFQHGYLMAPELTKTMEMLEFTTLQDTGKQADPAVDRVHRRLPVSRPGKVAAAFRQGKGISAVRGR